MRTVEWTDQNRVRMIDQRQVPWQLAYVEYDDYRMVAQAIAEMVVRGAPAIGVSAAFAMALTLIIGWRAWSLLAWVGALVIGLSRLALGVHWVEDVLTGWILEAIVAAVTWWISLKLTPGKRL